jgi:hypothetical protein
MVGLTCLLAGSGPRDDQTAQPGQSRAWNFDKDEAGKLPEEWSVRMTNPKGALAKWHVTADSHAPSPPNVMTLTQTTESGSTFNLLINDDTSYKDLDLSVKIKANSGKEDQGGGLLWRCIDQDNYYICRINPLEGNYRVYKVVEGKRTQLGSASAKLETGKWYTLRVTMVGDQISCDLDGQKTLEAKDDTFKGAGTIGLWTKADAASSFDDLMVHATASTERGAASEQRQPPKNEKHNEDEDDHDE